MFEENMTAALAVGLSGVSAKIIYVLDVLLEKINILQCRVYIVYSLEWCPCPQVDKFEFFKKEKKVKCVEDNFIENILLRTLKESGATVEQLRKQLRNKPLLYKFTRFLIKDKVPQDGDPIMMQIFLKLSQMEQQRGLDAKHVQRISTNPLNVCIASKDKKFFYPKECYTKLKLFTERFPDAYLKPVSQYDNYAEIKVKNEKHLLDFMQDDKFYFTTFREMFEDKGDYVLNFVRVFIFHSSGDRKSVV